MFATSMSRLSMSQPRATKEITMMPACWRIMTTPIRSPRRVIAVTVTTTTAAAAAATSSRRSTKNSSSSSSSSSPSPSSSSTTAKIVQCSPDASDAWRLAPVIDCLRAGGVAVVPTDSFPALVVDCGCRDGPARLYKAKGVSGSQRKPLSVLCRGFADIDAYTLGWPAPSTPGAPAMFRVAKSALPGPYTLIMQASNALPRHCVDAENPGKKKSRRTIGVRLTSHPVTAAILAELERPLLAATVGADNASGGDAAGIADALSGRGGVVEFVVDCGDEGGSSFGLGFGGGGGGGGGRGKGGGMEGGIGEGSTVIDLTVSPPKLVRWGRGDPEPFLGEEAMADAESKRWNNEESS